MIEAGANEVPEDKMIEAIFEADKVNKEIIKFIDQIVKTDVSKIQELDGLEDVAEMDMAMGE